MALVVEVDVAVCNGYGNCAVAAPEVFDLDPDTNIVLVKPGRPTDDDEDAVLEAVADCPVRALKAGRSA